MKGRRPPPPAEDSPRDAKGFLATILESEGIEALAQMTGLDNSKVAGLLVLALVALFFGAGGDLVCNVIGFVYPMYKSFQAIESTGLGVHESEKEATEEDLEACVHLLMYWVVYTFFTLGEMFSDVLLYWVPFYYPLKLGLLIWCLKYNGAQRLYASTFGRLLKQYEPQIEQAGTLAQRYAGQLADDVKGATGGLVKQHSAQLAGGAASVFAAVQRNVGSAASDGSGRSNKAAAAPSRLEKVD
jgi:receptor expression-enhancing protein 5/6